jgi:hypothetical protein
MFFLLLFSSCYDLVKNVSLPFFYVFTLSAAISNGALSLNVCKFMYTYVFLDENLQNSAICSQIASPQVIYT